MQLKEFHPNSEQALNGHQELVVRMLAREGPDSAAAEHTEITLTNIADAEKEGVKEAIANEDERDEISEMRLRQLRRPHRVSR